MWEDGLDLNWLKLFIEFREKNGEDQGDLSNTMSPIDSNEIENMQTQVSNETKNVHTQDRNDNEKVHSEVRNESAPTHVRNENAAPHVDDSSNEEFHLSNEIEKSSEDESLVEGIETDDEDYMIAMQNRKALRAFHGGKVQVDRNFAASGHVSDYEDSEDDGFETPYSSDENDLGETVKRKRKKFDVYNPNCDHAKKEQKVQLANPQIYGLLKMCDKGKLVEEEEGNFALWLSYILTGVGANLVSWLVLPRNAVSVGASGAVFGLFAISVLVKITWDWRKILEVLILGQFVIEKVMEAAQASAALSGTLRGGYPMQSVNHIAHLSGALIGVVLVWLVSRIPSAPDHETSKLHGKSGKIR
ncbi:hypothetical protein GH714_035953 [Hevea brasiliensis]|uniref:Peptidase S54 rhomboid domain-containing protein n=1 Tax=Hevea brasiliensis TaxID=3981 RepID=A0A6A6KFL6_HEVBR|nr:hypothetical protein GH714_035953 [Hevea brasiliensis]